MVDKLVEALKKIEESKEVKEKQYLTNGYFSDLHPLIQEARNLACDALISKSGCCNWDNINKLKESGYKVFPGERDSFGWLTGCIRTSKGIVVFD